MSFTTKDCFKMLGSFSWPCMTAWLVMAITSNVNVRAFVYPSNHARNADWEPVHVYRQKRDMDFAYTPTHVHPEMCRHLTKAECQHEDEMAARALNDKRRRLVAPSSGNIRALIVLAQFLDHVDRELPPKSYFQEMCDGATTGTDANPVGSMASYFSQYSQGTYNISCYVSGWHVVDNTEIFYSQGSSGLLGSDNAQRLFASALDAVQAEIDPGLSDQFWYLQENLDSDDDGYFDAVLVFHSGHAAEEGDMDCYNKPRQYRIWSQGHISSNFGWIDSWGTFGVSGYAVTSALDGPTCDAAPAKMGIGTHEWMHMFGLPDLYDTGTSGMDGAVRTRGIGGFDLMGDPLGPGRDGGAPGGLSPWSRLEVNWMTATEITGDGAYKVTASDTTGVAFKIAQHFPENEYLLIENRQPHFFDAHMYGSGGIVIYHVDDSMPDQTRPGMPDQSGWPQNGNHYRVAVLAPDGQYDLEHGEEGDEGDVWIKGMKLAPYSVSQTYPNSDAYQGGNIVETGITIEIMSDPGDDMYIVVSGVGPAINDGTVPSGSVPATAPADSAGGGDTPPAAVPDTAPSDSTGSGNTPATTPTDNAGSGGTRCNFGETCDNGVAASDSNSTTTTTPGNQDDDGATSAAAAALSKLRALMTVSALFGGSLLLVL